MLNEVFRFSFILSSFSWLYFVLVWWTDYFGNGKNVTWSIQSTKILQTWVGNTWLVSFNHFHFIPQWNHRLPRSRAADFIPTTWAVLSFSFKYCAVNWLSEWGQYLIHVIFTWSNMCAADEITCSYGFTHYTRTTLSEEHLVRQGP